MKCSISLGVGSQRQTQSLQIKSRTIPTAASQPIAAPHPDRRVGRNRIRQPTKRGLLVTAVTAAAQIRRVELVLT